MQELEIDGVVRDLRHLRDIYVIAKGKGKDGADLRVKVFFSLHAISESCDLGRHDLLDENGKPRKFCEDRYAFSLGLHELAKRMIEQNYFCWNSEDRNRAMNYALIDIAPGRVRELIAGEHQTVFFYLYPSRDGDADVKLFITSCYPRYTDVSRIKRRYNIHTMLKKCLYEQKRLP